MNADQQNRCSDQRHLWRRSEVGGAVHMRCACGAVHPTDLDAFLRSTGTDGGAA